MKRLYTVQNGLTMLVLVAAFWLTLFYAGDAIAAAVLFTEHTVSEDFDGARDVYAADLDGDGDLDILGTAYDGDQISWWANNGNGQSWVEHTVAESFNGAIAVMAVDMDGDGDLDVLAAAKNADSIIWWANNGDGTSWSEHIVDSMFEDAYDVYAADIDGDGDMDVAGAAQAADEISWWANNGDGSAWTKQVVDGSFLSAQSVYVADVDGDSDLDLLGAALVADDIVWWANNGDGSAWTKQVVDGAFDGAHDVYSADIDGDNDLDILAAARNHDEITWWANNGDGSSWTEHLIDGEFDGAYDVIAADIDEDGDLDVLGAANKANALSWWENSAGDGTTWSKRNVDNAFDEASSVYAADIDGDDDVDILGAAKGAHDITWWQKEVSTSANPLQGEIDAATAGDTIQLESGVTYVGGVTVDKELIINLNGATVGAGSPAFTITAPNVTILNGTLDGAGNGSPAILIESGGDNFTLKESEVKNWADGVQVSANVTSFKLVGNHMQDNSDAALQVDSGVQIGGIITIEGNLFKNNGGNGIQNDGSSTLPAQYNSWGDADGADAASGGDGVSANVDASNPTFAELFVSVNPGTEDSSRTVSKGETFNVTINVDAAQLYGLQYKLTYSDTLLTLDSVAYQNFKGSGSCTNNTSSSGTVSVICSRYHPDTSISGIIPISELTFTANGTALTGDGPWSNHFDLSHLTSDLAAGARNGVKVYVNNAGFGDPSEIGRTITDANDGEIIITTATASTGHYSGYIDREGRADDSGVTVQVYDQQAVSGATLLGTASNTADGSYTTVDEGDNELTVGESYYFQADAPLHLPITGKNESNYTQSAELSTALTSLSTLVLLGGDANNDDTITLTDATCIASDLGTTSSSCTGDGASSDVNGDGKIDLVDLVLMASNYSKTSSPWTP